MTPSPAIDIALQKFSAGDLVGAESLCCQIVSIEPDHVMALQVLGLISHRMGRSQEGIELLLRCIELQPRIADYRNTLATMYLRLGRPLEAAVACKEAVQLRPTYPEAHANLAIALERLGRLGEAETAARQAIGLRPGYPAAIATLGDVLRRQGRLGEAIGLLRSATHVASDVSLLRPLAHLLVESGDVAEAIEHYRRALTLFPDAATVHSDLLFALCYDPSVSPEQLSAEHRQWDSLHGDRLRCHIRPHANDRSPNRRLRIGYVSADFCYHTRSRFMEGVLSNHDHEAFEVFCYSDVQTPDAVTHRFQTVADAWRNITGYGDDPAAELIRRDQIDILVELTGHMGHNRLSLFARKPAPIQIAYPGYPHSTGLSSINYLITDETRDPAGVERFYTERLIRLPTTSQLYTPWISTPGPEFEPGEPPCLRNGFVTFGCFNKPAKLTMQILETWAEILRQVPDSRLIILAGDDPAFEWIVSAFITFGIDPSRIQLQNRVPARNYLKLHQRIDICLDTFPYNGHTTTLDALWMGVPSISLYGETHRSREGLAVLTLVGLAELACRSLKRYVDSAVALAHQVERLRELRSDLRRRLADSPLGAARQLTANIEFAYRSVWQAWSTTSPQVP